MRIHLVSIIVFVVLCTQIGGCNLSVGPEGSATSHQLTFAGYGQHVLRGIYAVDAGATSIKRLTPDSMDINYKYSCSQDGESILFAMYTSHGWDIWKIARTNRIPIPVIADGFSENPQWLYDGRGFVFRSARTGRSSIWMCDLNGAGQRQITPDTGSTPWTIPSPRRPLIAISYPFQALFVLDYEHNQQFQVSPDSLRVYSAFPSWSASGDMLAFETNHDLYTWNRADGLQRCWTDNNIIWNPIWSPDNQQIAFNAFDTLKVFDLSSRTVRSLMSGMAPAGRSSWSPDGKTIAVEIQSPTHIVLVAVDGGSITEIPVGDSSAMAPTWINAIW